MAKPDTPVIVVGVMSSCGHSWTETRPAGTVLPVFSGELRVCGHPDCYPGEFPVTYTEPVALDIRRPLGLEDP